MASTTNSTTTKVAKHSKLDDAKLTLEGVKDKLFGGVKQTVGHLLRKPELKSRGREQRTRADAELKHHRGLPELTAAQLSEMHMKREALMADVARSGGMERMTMSGRLRHVETRETSVKELFTWQPFALKRWSNAALLDDIRQCNTMKPLVHVETVEKGLMHSIMLDAKKGDFELRRRDGWTSLWADIRRGDNVARLTAVEAGDKRDRSAPRLDVLRSVSAAQAQRGEVLRQIAIPHKILNHVETEDKARPELWFAKADSSEVNPIIGTGLNTAKVQLLDAVRQGVTAAELKHVETNDKAKLAIEDDASVRMWNKEGFLSEVRQGTELRHI